MVGLRNGVRHVQVACKPRARHADVSKDGLTSRLARLFSTSLLAFSWNELDLVALVVNERFNLEYVEV